MGGNGAVDDGAESTDSGGEGGVTVNIRCSNGSKFTVQVNLESTIGSFKTVLARTCDIPADQQRLIYKGRILKDDHTLKIHGLEAEHTIHLVKGISPVASANTSAGAANPVGLNITPSNARGSGLNEGGALGGSDLGASLFPGLGVGGLGSNGYGARLPEFDQVQQQLTQNPNLMREVMNMPVVQNLMNNPDIMRNMIMNNPQMREIIDRNPDLAHILNDPNTLRQTLETARNPELMREMMRNTDRAMSNIESSPEGYNMLRRMYENVQEPLLNATTMGGNARNDDSNPFAALSGTQGVGQTRERSTNSSSDGDAAGSPAPNTNPLPNPWTPAGAGGAQANSTRSNPIGGGRPQTPAGLGGLGAGFEGMLGPMQDPSSLNQFMQDPAVSQMMQSSLQPSVCKSDSWYEPPDAVYG